MAEHLRGGEDSVPVQTGEGVQMHPGVRALWRAWRACGVRAACLAVCVCNAWLFPSLLHLRFLLCCLVLRCHGILLAERPSEQFAHHRLDELLLRCIREPHDRCDALKFARVVEDDRHGRQSLLAPLEVLDAVVLTATAVQTTHMNENEHNECKWTQLSE